MRTKYAKALDWQLSGLDEERTELTKEVASGIFAQPLVLLEVV
jgi:hypothetical protein